MKTTTRASLVLAALFFLAVPVAAHHSVAAIFKEQTFTIQGTLAEIAWVNPHTYFRVDVKDGRDNVRTYTFEGLPPTMLRKLGMTKDLWTRHIGRTVTVKALSARDGRQTFGFPLVITFPDGKSWEILPPSSRGPEGK